MLFQVRENRVAYWWFFGIISWRRLWERFSTLSPIASRTKSCMVLTCSMATTNNIGDEPRPTALERQVQTLMAAVERLTKQNHDLKEQLRQRNAGHST